MSGQTSEIRVREKEGQEIGGKGKEPEQVSLDVTKELGKHPSNRYDRYNRSDEGKAARARYKQSDEGQAARARYKQSDEGQAARDRYEQSEKGKAARDRYKQSDEGQVARARAHEERNARRYGQQKVDLPNKQAALHPDTQLGEEGVLSFGTRRSYVPAEMLRRELAESRARGEQEHDPKMQQAIKEIEQKETEQDDKTDRRLNS